MHPLPNLEFSELEERLRISFKQTPGIVYAGKDTPTAAVCAILKKGVTTAGHELLLVKRVVSPRDPWSGQMALPGGRSLPNETLQETAIREVYEETKIVLINSELLGPMDEVTPGNRIIKVSPFVAFKQEPLMVVSNGIEIAEHFWIPLSFFLDANNSSKYEFTRNGSTYIVPSFAYLGKNIVWGMTLRIIRDLIARLS